MNVASLRKVRQINFKTRKSCRSPSAQRRTATRSSSTEIMSARVDTVLVSETWRCFIQRLFASQWREPQQRKMCHYFESLLFVKINKCITIIIFTVLSAGLKDKKVHQLLKQVKWLIHVELSLYSVNVIFNDKPKRRRKKVIRIDYINRMSSAKFSKIFLKGKWASTLFYFFVFVF